MKFQAVRNSKGEIVATFEAQEAGAIAPEAPKQRGFSLRQIDAPAKYSDDPSAFYKRLKSKG